MRIFYRVHSRLACGLASAKDAAKEEQGQTFTEYAVIVATIAIGTVAAVGYLRDAVTNALSNAADAI